MKNLIYLTGGARSGKSSFALQCADTYDRKAFLATAEAFDEEMQRRILKHKEERGDGYYTIEEPLHIDRAISAMPGDIDVVIVDCLTVWAGNLMHAFDSDEVIMSYLERFMTVLKEPPCNVILVSNEVGMGIVPDNAMARKFRDITGIINQKTAAAATHAWLLCSGIPMKLK